MCTVQSLCCPLVSCVHVGLCLELFRCPSITAYALLYRYKVASADPEQISRALGSLPDDGDGRVEVDKRARSLTRCLTRSAASSPLVQLLATHRRRRYHKRLVKMSVTPAVT